MYNFLRDKGRKVDGVYFYFSVAFDAAIITIFLKGN